MSYGIAGLIIYKLFLFSFPEYLNAYAFQWLYRIWEGRAITE